MKNTRSEVLELRWQGDTHATNCSASEAVCMRGGFQCFRCPRAGCRMLAYTKIQHTTPGRRSVKILVIFSEDGFANVFVVQQQCRTNHLPIVIPVKEVCKTDLHDLDILFVEGVVIARDIARVIIDNPGVTKGRRE